MTWEPITKAGLLQAIKIGEQQLEPSHLTFWNSIKVEPAKWQEPDYGEAGGGFWVVAVSAPWVMANGGCRGTMRGELSSVLQKAGGDFANPFAKSPGKPLSMSLALPSGVLNHYFTRTRGKFCPSVVRIQ